MKFQVSFDVSNDAFDDSEFGGLNPSPNEIARILLHIGNWIAEGSFDDPEDMRMGRAIKDRNGNTVGRWSLVD